MANATDSRGMTPYRFLHLTHHILKEKNMGFLNGSNGQGPEPEDNEPDWFDPIWQWPLRRILLFLALIILAVYLGELILSAQ